ncbi:MAG: DUF2304 domain-containing protein [Bacteroidia bacterium]
MTTFQIILVVALIALLAVYFVYFKNRLIIRLLMLSVFFGGIVLAINPDLSIRLANVLGIGRGVDLIIYICILMGFLGFIVLYSKYRKMEEMLTELIRKESVRTATDESRNKK